MFPRFGEVEIKGFLGQVCKLMRASVSNKQGGQLLGKDAYNTYLHTYTHATHTPHDIHTPHLHTIHTYILIPDTHIYIHT